MRRGKVSRSMSYYVFLILLSFLSFGGHFARSSISMFGLYLINDEIISPAGLGVLLSAASLPALLIPLIVGHLIDNTQWERLITLVMHALTILGLILFAVSIYLRYFWLGVLALVIYGSGASSITVIQRILVTLYLKSNITFTTGFYIAMANVAKLLGKVTIGPFVDLVHSYRIAIVLPVLACILSLGAYLGFVQVYSVASWNESVTASNSYQGGDFSDLARIEEDSLESRHQSISSAEGVNTMELELESSRNSSSKERQPLLANAKAAIHATSPAAGRQQQQQQETYQPALSTNGNSPDSSSSSSSNLSRQGSSPVSANIQEFMSSLKLPTLGSSSYDQIVDVETGSERNGSTKPCLGCGFYWFASMHSLYILIFHALVSFLPHYAYRKWGGTVTHAGNISSIPHLVIIFVAPATGLLIDHIGYRTSFCLLASIITVIAYWMLVYSSHDTNPYLVMTLISLSQGLIPALTLAQVSRICPEELVGLAFGIIEVLDSLVNVFGNVLFGELYNVTGSYKVGMVVLFILAAGGMIIFSYLVASDTANECRSNAIEEQVREDELRLSRNSPDRRPSLKLSRKSNRGTENGTGTSLTS